MNSNKGQSVGADAQDKYEATVLDFLDREMATVQVSQKKSQQSDELDALVTDLLKQVITEADQKQEIKDRPLFDEDELFSGLTTNQKQGYEPVRVDAVPTETPADAEEMVIRDEPPAEAAMQVVHPKTQPAAPSAVFSSKVEPQRKFPVMIAAAAAVVVIIGAGAYFFTGSSGPAPVAETAVASRPATAELTKAPAAAPVTVQPPQPVGRAVAASQKPAPRTPLAKTAQAPVPQPGKPSAGSGKPEQIPVMKAPIEEPVVAQPVQVNPIPVQTAAVTEKLAGPADHSLPPLSLPERKSAPALPFATISETPVSASQPAVSTPNKLVAAVPLVQATPVFPDVALRAKASGSVILELQIDDQGKVVRATPVSGPVIFHNAAVAAVMKWRYKPASIGGVNVSSQSRVTMAFNMKK